MNKELEEAAERHYINCIPSDRQSFIAGAKWQAKRGYSEEQVIELLNQFRLDTYNYGMSKTEFEEWCEEFKKTR